MPESPHSRVRSEYAQDPDMAELVQIFVAELPKRIAAMEAAHREGALSALTRLAHQMKGAAGGYGFPSISQLAGRLEATIKESREPERALKEASDSLRELVELCGRVVAS